MKKVEIRVRPVTRYVVTRYTEEHHEAGGVSAGSECLGEFSNETNAAWVAGAAKAFSGTPECEALERERYEAFLKSIG